MIQWVLIQSNKRRPAFTRDAFVFFNSACVPGINSMQVWVMDYRFDKLLIF
jgi:hypothetical protein